MIDYLVGSAPLVSHMSFFVVSAIVGFVGAFVSPVFKKYFGVAGLVAAAMAFTLHVGARDMKRYVEAQEAHAVKKQAVVKKRVPPVPVRRPPVSRPR
ncbi:MAG: hypothetical protein L0Y60_14675 [Beijerinckiaceae bacterium]|nr:hypothetical protein [Beijerinckiaceae bacterium]